MRIVVILFLVLIVASLGSALMSILRNKDGTGSARTARALAIRVALSITLFLMLMAGFATGFIDGKL
ncbi:DUF2909 domain-containing protein [Azoarcus sp. L1K30]|uniref:DUF2909 domain-containing protein n=1 Tax=Azoarcus sp. L1K30 TaxID=2820277 RepID=UPI001B83C9C4|nr:DUF2909 domain-containing protein [Azoarcus sp. L1K30]MBR0567865.1 DUF2909 domain-containing protein [Azoarcus sp. L1K30]